MSVADLLRTFKFRIIPLSLSCLAFLLVAASPALAATKAVVRDPNAKPAKTVQSFSRTDASQPSSAANGPLRILLVDDDVSDNNNIPGDTRKSVSDTVFRKLVADAVGGDAAAWAVETVKTNANGPGIDKLRNYSLIVWYTGASYGGNPDNTSVLSIEDEKTVRRYLQETGGAVILISPGYAGKVLEQGSSWEQTSWPFLTEVLGIQGGRGLVQRFLPGTVITTQGDQFEVGKGGAVESQFSAVNPSGATVVFNAELEAMGGKPVPVATANSYGKGRIIYVGFTFENLAAKQLAPAFQQLLAATGLTAKAGQVAACPAQPEPPTLSAQMQAAGPETVQASGTPTTAVVSWTLATATILNASLGVAPTTRTAKTAPPAQTTTVTVVRLVPNAAAVKLNNASPDASTANDPGPLTPGRAVTYRVKLMDGCNVLGARDVSYTPPMPHDPSGLTATTAADGTVTLKWQPIDGVAGYQITGTTLTAPVKVSYTTQWTSPPQAPGAQQWKIASEYAPGGILTAASAWPSVMSHIVPTPNRPYLSMPNGPGSIAESTDLYAKQCEAADRSSPAPCPEATWFLSLSVNWDQTYSSKYGGDGVGPAWPIAAFADLHDLGLGRRVNCTPIGNAASRGTLCWATSHGHIPAPSETPNGVTLANAGEQMVDIKSVNIIITSAQGAFFGTWEPARPIVVRTDTASQREDAFVDASGKRYVTALDSQGLKSVPNACLSCHGGRYDATRKIIVGASLQPLIPANLTFSSPQARANSEEPIRRINQIILDSNPTPTISTQIATLYNGSPGTPGITANDAAVPAGWASQPGLYKQVIAPYCGTCHFAQTGPLNFATYANVLANKQRIQRAVCVDFSMPHSEQGLRRFWTEGGTVSLPGMLSTALGFPKCPQ